MAENQLAQQAGPITTIKKYINDPETQQRLRDMLGAESGTFANSIVNLVSGSAQLKKCEPSSVMRAAMISASVKLPIDPALGFAAIVPYGGIAQFQLMYKGVIQLCIRSGEYEKIHDTEVYRDELQSYNPITGEVRFRDLTEYKMRPQHDFKDVVGFYCEFKLLKGFRASLYMTKEEVMEHAKRYSKAYQYDLRAGKKDCPWSTDPIAMGRKTVILGLLKRYGIMSVEMQRAVIEDAEDESFRHQVESRTIEPTNGRKPFGFNTPSQTGAEETPGTEETGQGSTEAPGPAEEGLKGCYYCGNQVEKRVRYEGHLACLQCAAGKKDESTGNGQDGTSEGTEDGAMEPTEGEPAPAEEEEFAPDTIVECDNKHRCRFDQLLPFTDGLACPVCNSINWWSVEEPKEETPPAGDPNEILRCKQGHTFRRSKVKSTPLAAQPGQLGKCPMCAKDDVLTIVWEP